MKVKRLFLYSTGTILILTAIAKLISSFGHGTILQTLDPVTGLQFQSLFRIVGIIEAIIAVICFFNKQNWFKMAAVAWLSTSFLVYRICLVVLGYHRPCGCMGDLTDAIHIPPQMADNLMKCILVYLLIGSYGIFLHQWLKNRKSGTGHLKLGGENAPLNAQN